VTVRGPILAIDTATSMAVVTIGEPDGTVRREASWTAGYRHGEELLARIVELLRAEGLEPRDLGAIVVGTGPGAFTGLRIGLATAKTLAHELDRPIVGVSTAAALAHAARAGGAVDSTAPLTVLLPAGPSGIVVVEVAEDGRMEPPRLVLGGQGHDRSNRQRLVAVDLDGRSEPPALERGRTAVEGLAAGLLALGAARLDGGGSDDVATLVPEYVTLPRGVAIPAETTAPPEVAWSRDRR
jgi:tRNA threonylcarbamoyl adenosine modification protein YeaZ